MGSHAIQYNKFVVFVIELCTNCKMNILKNEKTSREIILPRVNGIQIKISFVLFGPVCGHICTQWVNYCHSKKEKKQQHSSL